MLSSTIVGLLGFWVVALYFSVALGGWIRLLPVAAAPLLLARVARSQPAPSLEYSRWLNQRAKRMGR